MRSNVRYKGNINNTSVILFLIGALVIFPMVFMSLGDLTELPVMVLCLGEPPGGFCDVGCCCFSSLELFTFQGYFSLPPALHPGFSGLWRPPPWLLLVALFLPGFFVTFLPRALRFWVCIFYPQVLFYLALLPHIFWHTFVTQMRAETPHLGSSSVPALTELSLLADAWTWTTHIVVARPLSYQLRQSATKYRVKIKLLNMLCLFKIIRKDYKNTLNKTW